MKIAVAGTGYVGLSMAVLLAQNNEVTAVDIIPEKVELINSNKSPIQDDYIEKYLAEKELDLEATLDAEYAYKDADFVVIAAPTNYDSKKNYFDTSFLSPSPHFIWSRPNMLYFMSNDIINTNNQFIIRTCFKEVKSYMNFSMVCITMSVVPKLQNNRII